MIQEQKFLKLQKNYNQRQTKIGSTKESREEKKLQKPMYLSGLINVQYFFKLLGLKIYTHFADKRYLRAVEKKKRFTLTMAGESRGKRFWVKFGQGILLFIVGFIIIFPFYGMLMTSFKPFSDVNPVLKETFGPKHGSLEAYEELFKYVDNRGISQKISFGRYFGNTIYIALISTVCQMTLSLFAGFAIFNGKTKLNPIILGLMFALIMIPGEAMLLGRYIFAVQLGGKDSVLALIVPFLGNVYTIYLISNALSVTTKDLKHASKVDGLSTFKYFYKIAIPAIKATIITSMIISFIEAGNSTLGPVMIMNSESQHATIPMLLYGLINIEGGSISTDLSYLTNPINFKMAASVISITPILLIFLIFNKPIIKGISNRNFGGSTKG